MTTRADLRARVRAELGDETLGAYVWSEALLNTYIADAIGRYSLDLPREAELSLAGVAGQHAYQLPVECLRVLRVEYPEGNFLPRDAAIGGDLIGSIAAGMEDAWEQYAGELWLRRAPSESGENIGVRFLARYPVPGDDVTTLDLPTLDEGLVVWLACEAALAWLNKQKDKRHERRSGFLYPATYAGRYQEGVRVRRRSRGLLSRRMASPLA